MIVARTLVFAAITVGLSAWMHAAAGGALPAPVGLAVLLVVTAAAGLPLLRRGLRPVLLVAGTGAAQLALHPVFQALAGTGVPEHHAGHGSAMLGGHVVAGVLAALLVTALDPVVRTLRLRAVRRVGRPAPPPLVDPLLSPLPVPAARPTGTWARVVVLAAPRRGPPAVIAS